ncbi:hypothetical protein [Pseudonocardia sp. DLS-67]
MSPNKRRASRMSDARISERVTTQAAAGSQAWEAAVGGQRVLRLPDHEGFYAVAGEVVATLRQLEELCGLLARQVAGYGHIATAVGGVLRDDEPGHDPGERVAIASSWAAQTAHLIATAEQAAGRFWSEVGHIAIDHTTESTDGPIDGAGEGSDAGEVTR